MTEFKNFTGELRAIWDVFYVQPSYYLVMVLGSLLGASQSKARMIQIKFGQQIGY